MFKNIILTGFMGTGKTSVGTRLAKELGYSFVDSDELIEADQHMTIAEIFEKRGEPGFRDVGVEDHPSDHGGGQPSGLHRRRRRGP